MVPGSDVDVPAEAASVARRYERIERPISWTVALLVGTVAAVALLTLPLVRGLLVAAAVLVAVRVPLFRSDGTARLVTDTDAAAVRADFESPCPPLLAFQWGIADAVRPTADGAEYELTYLFGTRSVTMETTVHTPSSDGGLTDHADERDGGEVTDELELVVTAAGQPWATYAVSMEDRGDETVVDVSWQSERRFDLRHLPPWLVGNRYRPAALAAQGYTVVERDATLSL
ncbi:hypothetical protein SAMN05216559_4164 [Halomicrobium zhouii]|uniref:Uncharacterized protein n=1 Tax=Halomicrobium zhouii TaxID=767519 RepID=A0A1I6MBH4_9EURY|nr:hypothetical protein [Halomicrobium zhouii]SFS12942.1 hypothetical protein SAMN05216559_4164 [Halomicrobium zhouii]